MPMKARVTNVAGRVLAETRDGTRRFFQHDALGNVIAAINDAGVVTDTYEYWSYGEIRTQTGTSNNPWKFCGAWGYYTDASGRQYVRARTLRNDLGRWITVDPLWPSEQAYGYAGRSPMAKTDPSGKKLASSGCGKRTKSCCESFLDAPDFESRFLKCMQGFSDRDIRQILGIWNSMCAGGRPNICALCAPDGHPLPVNCPNPCTSAQAGQMLCTTIKGLPWDLERNLCKDTSTSTPCYEACAEGQMAPGGCDCAVVVCRVDHLPPVHPVIGKRCPDTRFCGTLFHEVIHCYGIFHAKPVPDRYKDIIHRADECWCKSIVEPGDESVCC